MFDAFINGRLSKGEWTHEAHLVTCWVALRDRTPREALGFLRASIKAHNCGIGISNTQSSGYHESLTVFYVGAVHQAAAPSLDALFAAPGCSRTAPLEFWTKETLWSVDARMQWLPPELAPLPWPVESVLDDIALEPASS